MDVGGDAEHDLDVVSDLVSDDIGLGEIPGGAEAIVEGAEEAQIDIDLLVAGTVEGTGRRGREAARRVDGAGEQDQLGHAILAAGLGELAPPYRLGVVEHEGNEIDELGVWILIRARRIDSRRLDRGRLRLAPATVEQGEEVLAKDRRQEQDDDGAAHSHLALGAHAALARLAAPILEIAAPGSSLPTHRRTIAASEAGG